MKKIFLLTVLLTTTLLGVRAQNLAVKMNGLGLVTFAGYGAVYSPTPNLGVEVAIVPRLTFDVDGYLNPFKFDANKSTRFWAVQPELRWWFCGKFNGSFVGLHGQYADFQNFGVAKYVYDGHFAGVGLSYGYVLPLAYRWKLEFNLGIGWNRVTCNTVWLRESSYGVPWQNYGPYFGNVQYMEPFKKNYWGITRAGVSITFVII